MLGRFSTKTPRAPFAFSSMPPIPRTPREWKEVLMEVKGFYFERYYKQCVGRAMELLHATKGTAAHPIYTTYLAFYAAISLEFLGQAAHLYSRNKVTYLHAALDAFLDCLSALPESIPLPELPTVYPTPLLSPNSVVIEPQSPHTPRNRFNLFEQEGQDVLASHTAVVETLTHMINVSLSVKDLDDPFTFNPENEVRSPFVRACLASIEAENDGLQNESLIRVRLPPIRKGDKFKEDIRNPLMPSPLRVRKPICDSPSRGKKYPTMFDTPAKQKKQSLLHRPLGEASPNRVNIDRRKSTAPAADNDLAIFSSPSRRLKPPTKDQCNGPLYKTPHKTNEQHREEEGIRDEAISAERIAHIVKFNRGVEFLRSQVTANIADIREHVEKIIAIQRARRARKMQRAASFWSFSAIGSEEPKARKEPEMTVDQFGNVMIKETKEQRIARLRAEGWNTVGLRSSRSIWKGARYYQDFCNMVLNELTVGN